MSLVSKVFSVAAVSAALVLAAAPTEATAPATAPKPPATATPAPATGAKPPVTTLAPPVAVPATPAPVAPAPTASAPAPSGPSLPDISEARLAIAKTLAKNAPAVGDFNGILPDLMQDTKMRLINLRPDLYKQISLVVENTAVALVPRRNDLDADIARVWARAFTDDELKAINAFFSSPVGQKYKMVAPQVGNDIVQAGQNWADRVSGEMFDKALAELKKQGFQF